MTVNEKNSTAEWIVDALFRLLEKQDYASITIQNIADEAKIGRRTFYRYFRSKEDVLVHTIKMYMLQLGEYFKENLTDKREDISFCYFSYWEQNIDFLLKMKKAGLTYMISEHFEDAVHDIAKYLNHISFSDEKASLKYYEQYEYEFGFRLAGYWRVTELWSQKNPRKSPREMSTIINEILWGKS